jgi:hypothetical protein
MSEADKLLLAAVILAAGLVYAGFEIGGLADELNSLNEDVGNSALGQLLVRR